ncbi:MAG: hypothetical protein AAF417_18630 [Pseudomonadota bacterium]
MSSLRTVLVVLAGIGTLGTLSAAEYPLRSDVESIDAIVAAYYDVISGPAGFRYDADRDRSLHAPNAIITRVSAEGSLQRHNLAAEQEPLKDPYPEGFFEYEIGRIVEEYGDLAHVWSTFEVRRTPEGETVSRGVNSISLYYHENRWWIASWSTQPEGDEPLPARYLNK